MWYGGGSSFFGTEPALLRNVIITQKTAGAGIMTPRYRYHFSLAIVKGSSSPLHVRGMCHCARLDGAKARYAALQHRRQIGGIVARNRLGYSIISH